MVLTGDLEPSDVVASFDSASVLHASLVAALEGRPFPNLGSPRLEAVAVRAGGRLPWSVLRGIYTRIGASEGIAPRRLGRVDLGAVAGAFSGAYPDRRYPAILVGSSNGALTHLAAAMQVPWLPDTVLVPVRHADDPDRSDRVRDFGAEVAPQLLERNPDVVLHHMHDPLQDALMSARMSYFRVKWHKLPAAYADFIDAHLAPGGQLVLVDDSSSWPVTRVADRHVFQAGGRGGVEPEDYLSRPHTPASDETAVESEWGLDPGFAAAVREHGHRRGVGVRTIAYRHPQTPAAAVAETMRAWYRERAEPADRLVVPSFILGDPWQTIATATVPFWTFFAVRPALDALEDYLARAEPYRHVHVFLFEHGADSPGIATPDDVERTIRSHGAVPHIEALDRRRFPHDIRSMATYQRTYDRLPRARRPWSPLPVGQALDGLAAHGMDVSGPPA